MPLPNQALVFVTDGRKSLFLRNHGDGNQLDLRSSRWLTNCNRLRPRA